jgi:hypothetical protein
LKGPRSDPGPFSYGRPGGRRQRPVTSPRQDRRLSTRTRSLVLKRASAIAPILAPLLALALLAATPATAQDVWGWSIIIPSVTGTDQLGLHLRERMQQQQAARAAAPPPAAADPQALRFTPSAEARAANSRRFLAQRRAGADPATVAQLETLLGDPQLIAKIGRELGPRGLRTDSMADAYAVWWITAWQAIHGRTDDPSPAALRAVQAQAQGAMLATPTLLAAPDADKQAFAEGLLIQAAILEAATEQVKQDPAQRRGLAQAVRRSARQVGLDLDAMTLTDRGFVGAGV